MPNNRLLGIEWEIASQGSRIAEMLCDSSLSRFSERIALEWLENWTISPRAYVEAHAHDDFELLPVANPETLPRAAPSPRKKASVIATLERT